jgi:hypothetical protein
MGTCLTAMDTRSKSSLQDARLPGRGAAVPSRAAAEEVERVNLENSSLSDEASVLRQRLTISGTASARSGDARPRR